ncbi:hypothetical protein GUITHDRAFT_105843 [Guillardia theta CCMP2712]|uniref:mRNA (guanine-N(7))-methyltransferase n=1 Tax=Guillardia theta (strain CCMP2712) TaxID=905079 RepID=L1JJG8_GUITC|nr:hypothetical protein GUITHDRAFT_105843 [Guillardia theta CCMP2712]EKX48235.1 hypothetical protein GUITHDRAFT_105843 [Guillardia theta CCMP2712]|eukprot:XP_005835215.1 hypothetical protein GUITHDRAFT_105843 [Guillardia theta CCMP2712]
MEQSQIERTKRHYDLHANEVIPRKHALIKRSQSQTIQLKRFHNEVKRSLIESFATRADHVLDLGCGRGGDLNKWFDAKIANVVGVDLSQKEIQEAIKRLHELRSKARGGVIRNRLVDTFNARFLQSDSLGISSPILFASNRHQFDAVTCMFALHYFFGTEHSLRNLLTTVSANLKVGGYFFGVCPDGRRVNDLLKKHNGTFTGLVFSCHIKNEDLPSLQFVSMEKDSRFGMTYTFALKDTASDVTGEVEDSDGSIEFMVFEDLLIEMAAEVDLVPVLEYDRLAFGKLLSLEATKYGLFKHFIPVYDNVEELETVSKLNCAFTFVKVDPNNQSDRHTMGKRQLGYEEHEFRGEVNDTA